MRIAVRNFYSIKYAELDIPLGVSVLAGKNGAGKTQLLVALASKGNNSSTLRQLGYDERDCAGANVEVSGRVLFRPSLRRIGETTRGSKYATIGATNYLDGSSGQGYLWSLDERFMQMHNRIANMFFAGTRQGADAGAITTWETLCAMFKDAFGRELHGHADASGAAIRVALPTGVSANFSTLSTGELEFLALACDILVESNVDLFLTDELDAHFHPDLQKKVIEIIRPHVGGRQLLISSHSPIVMLSVSPECVFFMEPASVTPDGAEENQIRTFGQDLELFESVAELYPGFVEDTRLAARMRSVGEREILNYAIECLKPSEVVGGDKARDADPQTGAIRAFLLAGSAEKTVVEVGAGTGRLLQAYDALDQATLKQITYIASDRNKGALAKLLEFADEKKLAERFKELSVVQELPATTSADLVLAPNMVHEVGADELAKFFTGIFRIVKSGGAVLILEQLELGHGEEKHVVFDGCSLKQLFARIESEGHIETRFSTPTSFGGKPLLEFSIHVVKPGGDVTDEDVIGALDAIIESGGGRLATHHDRSVPLKALQLAFVSHNTANAVAYRIVLRKRLEASSANPSN